MIGKNLVTLNTLRSSTHVNDVVILLLNFYINELWN